MDGQYNRKTRPFAISLFKFDIATKYLSALFNHIKPQARAIGCFGVKALKHFKQITSLIFINTQTVIFDSQNVV